MQEYRVTKMETRACYVEAESPEEARELAEKSFRWDIEDWEEPEEWDVQPYTPESTQEPT